jgi:hypothetical protein
MLLLSPQMDAVVGKLEDIQLKLPSLFKHISKTLKRQAKKIECNRNAIESLQKKPRTEHSDFAKEKGIVLIISKLVKLCKINLN